MNKVHLSRSQNLISRGRLLEAARLRFEREGYERFSMRGLASDLGCAVGTLYLHCASKEAVFHALVEASFDRLAESLQRLCERHTEGDPVALLKKAMYTYVEFGLRNPRDYEWAFLTGAAPQPCRVRAGFEALRGIVERCVTRDCFREVDIDTVAQALWAAAHGVTALLIQQPDFAWVSRSQLIGQVIQNSVDHLVVGTVKTKVVA